MGVKHSKVSSVPDGGDANLVRPSDWNAAHVHENENPNVVLAGPASAPAAVPTFRSLVLADMPIQLYTAVSVQTLVAGDAITVTAGSPYRLISSASTITLTSQPTIAAGRNGQVVYLKNVGSYNITLQDVNALGGSLLRLTANTLTIQPGGTMGLFYDSTLGFWIETFLLNPQTFTPAINTFTVDLFASATHEAGGASSPESPSRHDFALTYIGTPSACQVDISGGEINPSDYPVTLVTPFLAYTGAPNFYRGTTVGSTRVLTATAPVAGQAG